WPTEWLLHTIMIAYQDYLYTGDRRLVEQYYQTLKSKTLYELAREDGLISASSEVATPEYLEKIGFRAGFKHMADIVDWPKASFTKGGNELGERDGHEMVAINTVVNCFYFNALVQMSELAQVIGNQEDAEFFAEESLKVRRAINEKLFDKQRGIYIDGEGSTHSSLHSNMMALAFDLVDDEHTSSVAEFVKSRGMACSVYGAQYLFEALYKAGEAEYALELMTNTTDRGWLNMIRSGSTMTLEAWDIKYKGNLDWNHAWGAAPANLIPRYMWGITPTSAGYTSASIKPQLAGLESAEITVPTLQGVIEASYYLKGGAKHYSITVPSNMEATFCVADEAVGVTVNGQKCDKLVKLEVGENQIVVKLE
ncbi:MAG: alpha-L-rhamnosidase C-terminal domain-containing protein, partial [Rikenellaceae bacterium]